MVIGVSSCFRPGYGSDSSFKEMPLRAFIAATMVPYSFWIIGAGVSYDEAIMKQVKGPVSDGRPTSSVVRTISE